MSYKGRYVEIVKNGSFEGVKYKIGEIWIIEDDHTKIVRCRNIINNKVTEINLNSIAIKCKECKLLPEDYILESTIIESKLQLLLW